MPSIPLPPLVLYALALVSRKKAASLMRENGLNARRKRKFIPTTDSNHGLAVCDNLLNREFHAERAGEKWVSDITYLRTRGGWVYLTVVLDLYDRKVIGWALSGGLEAAQTTIPALEMAFANRKAREGLIFHSDRGVQYCAKSFRDRLKELCPQARQSMSRKGNCWDNACAETFFKTLKRELETVDGRHGEAEVRQSVFMYLEAYYNRIRRTLVRYIRRLIMSRLMGLTPEKLLNGVYLTGQVHYHPVPYQGRYR
jgi:transposase InsO family protein